MAADATAIECVKQYLVGLESGATEHHFVLKSEAQGAASVLNWAAVPGYADIPLDLWSNGNVCFLVGENGHIWRMTDPTVAAVLVDAGVAVSVDLFRVDGISDEFAVAVGADGTVVFTNTGDGTIWQTAPSFPVGAGVDLIAVAVRSESEWLVGTDAGELWYTLDAGVSWTIKGFPGSGAGNLYDIQYSNDSVVYLAHDPAADDGRILRSYDGGFSWNIIPESSEMLPDNTSINRLAACQFDPNFVVGVGIGVAADGIVVIGED
jgi:hypothetical protein